MTPLAEQLMSGPRGRQLCLLAACFADRGVSEASQRIGVRLDSGVDGGWYAPGGIGINPGSEDLVSTLVATLAAVEAIDDHWIHLALESIVEQAMYWQEPHDIVASRPEPAVGLRRIAEIVAVAPVTQWWTAGIDRAQFAVWMGGRSEGIVLRKASEHLDVWRAGVVRDEVTAARERPSDPRARYGGIWWSRPPYSLPRTCSEQAGVPTGLYLIEDGFGETRAAVDRVRASGRVFEIDSAAAWAELCRRYPLDVTASKRHDWYRTTGLADTRWVMPDWAAVAEEYDAVHLQVGAYLAASGTAIEVEPGVHSVIAGWAPGDTFWLTDVVEVEPRGRVFVKDQGDDLWHAVEETA
ncbi:hypothetical protein TSST111916_14385 [Tsukamurella strandjordii]|uniref:hypothetical protein n=1 Tax=Tsukamurella TaxID=2060 RepID=UPI001C7DA3E9|nr:hypothetical protein [Tsukamurella sp. TY48]GIZ97249.1 hypothetical protein TTY48_18610 [Tsukamurella sp. TY48]